MNKLFSPRFSEWEVIRKKIMFDMGKWLSQLLETTMSYVELRKYVEDEHALAVYKQKIYALATVRSMNQLPSGKEKV